MCFINAVHYNNLAPQNMCPVTRPYLGMVHVFLVHDLEVVNSDRFLSHLVHS